MLQSEITFAGYSVQTEKTNVHLYQETLCHPRGVAVGCFHILLGTQRI